MKIRNGFVSNSSSSSFVIIMRDDVKDKVLKELPKYEASMFNKLFSNKKLGNEHLTYFSGRVGSEASSILDDLCDLEGEENFDEDYYKQFNSREKAFFNILRECCKWKDGIIFEEECY